MFNVLRQKSFIKSNVIEKKFECIHEAIYFKTKLNFLPNTLTVEKNRFFSFYFFQQKEYRFIIHATHIRYAEFIRFCK